MIGAIHIKPIGLSHVEEMQRLASDPAVCIPVNFIYPYPENGAAVYVKNRIEAYKAGTAFTFGIMRREAFVGSCSLHSLSAEKKSAEIAFWVGKSYWGMGYASQAVRCLIIFAFHKLDLQSLIARCFEDNEKAIKILEKFGFYFTSVDPSNRPNRSIPLAIKSFQLTREAWCREDTR